MFAYETYDGVGLASLLRTGEITPLELLEAVIGRIEALNPRLNAVVTKFYDRARQAAHLPPVGPFGGVPLLLKDILGDVAGVETRSGSRFMAGYPAPCDHTLVRRLRTAGFTLLGKTNVPEFGMRPVTDSVLYGPARNPWDPHHTTGGSSGGAAAAVAAGLTPIAHGGDAGGSIRMPASCCGLVGLKPTRGRVPQGPEVGERMAGFLQEHVLTRTVRDSAAVLDCTHGPEPGDPYVAPVVEGGFLAGLATPPRRMRFAATLRTASGGRAHKDCAAAVMAAAEALTALGHRVEMAEPPAWPDLLEPALVLGAACVAAEIDAHAARSGRPPTPELFEPANWELYQAGRGVSAVAFLEAQAKAQAIAREIGRFMAGYDVWLTPTLPEPPVRLDAAPEADPVRRFDAIAYVLVANATGQPSISLPLHWNAAGLPIGVLFTGRFGDEDGLLRLAAELEAAQPWAGRRPPIFDLQSAETTH